MDDSTRLDEMDTYRRMEGGDNDSCNFGPFRVGSVKSPLIVALVTA